MTPQHLVILSSCYLVWRSWYNIYTSLSDMSSLGSRQPMSALARFESFMENMVEGSVARFFRSPVQPAEIAKRLERAMETNQTISVRRVIVPNVYQAFLNPQDFAAFQPIRVEMEREMATYLSDLAQERGFTMLEHPRVELREDSSVPRRSI